MSKKIIYIADDDQGILDSLSLLLEEYGYKVKTIVNGDAVIQDFKNNCPDLLLLDIWMAGWDGRDICRELKNDDSTKHVPIIIISANKDISKIAKEAGADDYAAKPFEVDELLTKITRHIGTTD